MPVSQSAVRGVLTFGDNDRQHFWLDNLPIDVQIQVFRKILNCTLWVVWRKDPIAR